MKSFHNRLPARPRSDRRDAARRVMLAIAAAAMASGAPARVYAQACPAVGAAMPAMGVMAGGVDPTTGAFTPSVANGGITADPTTAAPTQAAAMPTPTASVPAATVGDPGTMTGASPAALTGTGAMIGVPPVPPPAPFTVDDPPSPLYPPGTPYPAGVPYPSSVPTQDNLGFYNGPDTSLDAEPMSDFATPSALK